MRVSNFLVATTLTALICVFGLGAWPVGDARAAEADYPQIVPLGMGPAVGTNPPSIRFVTSDDFPPFNFIDGSGLITGVIVARRDVVEANPGAVDSFLQNYAASVEWVNANNADAAQLIAEYGIIEAAPVAEKALPYCNIVCITGSEMKDKLSGYLQVLADAEPSSVGGTLPGDDFYYGG